MTEAAIHDILLYSRSRRFLEQLVEGADEDYLIRLADTPRQLKSALVNFNPDLLLYHATVDEDLEPLMGLAGSRSLPPSILLTHPWIAQHDETAAKLIDLGISQFIPLPIEPSEILARLVNYFVLHTKSPASQQFKRLFPAGEAIFLENEVGHECYAIESGRVRICRVIDSHTFKEIAQLGPGEIFGEMALLRDARRSGAALAVDDVVVTVTTAETFNRVAEQDPSFTIKLNRVLIERTVLLERALGIEPPVADPTEGRESAGEAVGEGRRLFRQGERLFAANHRARRCYLVTSGMVRLSTQDVSRKAEAPEVAFPDMLIGDVAWKLGRAYGQDAVALEDTICLEISADTGEPGLSGFLTIHLEMARNLASRLQWLLNKLSAAQMTEVF